MLYFFHVALFILHHFHVALFFVWISFFRLFMYFTISCCTFTPCNVFVLHSSPVALFAFCDFFLLHLFMFHYFQRCSLESHKHLRWRTLQQYLTKLLKVIANLSMWNFSGCPGYVSAFSMLHFSPAALFYYWKILKRNKRQKTKPKNDLTLSTVNLFHFYFDIL